MTSWAMPDDFGGRFIHSRIFLREGGPTKFDFETWLVQNYGVKAEALTEEELSLAKDEYEEEYPPVGEGDIKLKTYPFKKYLESRE